MNNDKQNTRFTLNQIGDHATLLIISVSAPIVSWLHFTSPLTVDNNEG
jgi:hypothetical protein